MELKEYLKNARKNVGLTQEEAANKIDISISTIQNWESGRVKFPAIDLFSNIIKVYQLDKEEFFKYYMIAVRKDIDAIEVKPDSMIILADENFNNMPNEKDFGQIYYINPYRKDTNVFINLMSGENEIVIDTLCNILIDGDLSSTDRSICKMVITNAVLVLKQVLGNNATIIDLRIIFCNINDLGRKNYVMPLRKFTQNIDAYKKMENDELIDWFLNDYYAGIGNTNRAPDTYKTTQCLRSNLNEIFNNKYLKSIFVENMIEKEEEHEIEYVDIDTFTEIGRIKQTKTKHKCKDIDEFEEKMPLIEEPKKIKKIKQTISVPKHNFDLYNLPEHSLVIFQCLTKNELFYKIINAMIYSFEKDLKIKKQNGEYKETFEIKK